MTQTSRLVIEIDATAAQRNVRIVMNELQRLNQAGNTTINVTNNINNSLQNTERQMNATSSAARTLLGHLGGMALAYKAITAADDFTGLKNRLVLVTNSQQELNAAMAATFDIAQKTGSTWENAALVYQRFAQNAKELGLSQQRLTAITETVAKATALSGGSAQSASAALTQFGQALASGVLRGEEFNSVMEQAPGLAQALAKGLGVPVGKLRALAQEGKITADAMIGALEKVAPEVTKSFDKTAFTIGQNLTKLQNSLVQFVGQNNGGSATALADGIGLLAQNLELVANTGASIAIGYLTKMIVASTTAGYQAITQTTAKIKSDQVAAAQTLRNAVAEKTAATAQMNRARDAVLAAEQKVMAERSVIESNIASLRSTQAGYAAELQLEQQRIRAQINQAGRTASATRMAQLRQAEVVVIRELQAAEAQLAATTTATSAQYAAAMNARTVATSRLTVATEALMVANRAAAAAGTLLTRAGAGLAAMLGGPMGIALLAAGAAFLYFRDGADETTKSIASQTDVIGELTEKYKELSLAQALAERGKLRQEMEESTDAIHKATEKWDLYTDGQMLSAKLSVENHKKIDALARAVRDGAMTSTAALTKLSNMQGITPEQIDRFAKMADEIDKNKLKLGEQKQQMGLVAEVSKTLTNVTADQVEQQQKQATITAATTQSFLNQKTALIDNLNYQIELARQHGASKTQLDTLTNAVNKFSTNSIAGADAAKVFAGSAFIPENVRQSISDQANKVDESKKAMGLAHSILTKLNETLNSGKTAGEKHAEGMSASEKATDAARKAYEKYKATFMDDVKESTAKLSIANNPRLTTDNQRAAALKTVQAFGYDVNQLKTPYGQQFYDQQMQLARLKDQTAQADKKREDALKAQTKELEKQGKVLIGISGNSGIGTGAHLDVRYGGGRDGRVSDEHLARLQAGGKSLGQYAITSEYGPRKAPVKGASTFHKGVDFSMDKGTPITTTVGVKSVKTYDSGKGGYVSEVTFEDGVILKLLHQSPNIMGKIQPKGTPVGKDDGDVAKMMQDRNEFILKNEEKQQQIKMGLYGVKEKSEYDHQKTMQDIRKEFANDPELGTMLAKEEKRYADELTAYQYAQDKKMQAFRQFTLTEQQQLDINTQQRIADLALETDMTLVEKRRATALILAEAKQQQGALKLAQQYALQESRTYYESETEIALQRYALERQAILDNKKLKVENPEVWQNQLNANRAASIDTQAQANGRVAAMGNASRDALFARNDPNGFAMSQLQNERNNAMLGLTKAGSEAVAGINSNPALDKQQRNEQILQAHQQFLDAKAAMDEEYNQKQKDSLATQTHAQLSMYGTLLSQAGNVWGDLTKIVKDAEGENSSSYKAMFLMQQAFAIGSALVSTHLAAAQVLSDPSALTAAQKLLYSKLILGLGYANVGMIAGQTIAGFATGGYTGAGGKYEPAGMVHKGEVVWSQDDIRRWGGVNNVEAMRTSSRVDNAIAQNRKSALTGNSSPVNITINHDPSLSVSQHDDGQGNITIEVIRQEIARHAPRAVADNMSKSPNTVMGVAMKNSYKVERNR